MVRKSWQEPNIFLSSLIKLSQLAFIIWTLSVENVDNFFSTWIGCKRRAHGGQLQRRFYLINISLFSKSKQESNLLKKISLFSSFLFALKFDQLKSINIWKSKLKISGKIILYKPCYNCKICNSVNVLYELFFSIAVCDACTSCCIICIWHFDIFLLNTIPRWNWWVQTPIQGCESYRSHFHFLKW